MQLRSLVPLCCVAAIACSLSAKRGSRSGGTGGADGNAVQTLPAGVGENPAEPNETANAVSAGVVGGPNGRYTLVGRFDASRPDRLTFSFANSKIGARFVGTQVSVSLATSGNDTYDATIDNRPGVVVAPLAGDSNLPQTFLLANDLQPDVAHTVWLTKRTEAFAQANDNSNTRCGAGTFYGFTFGEDGHFLQNGTDANVTLTPGTRPHLIEAIGDSAFTGYGVLNFTPAGQTNTCRFNPNQENALLSIPAFLAKQLDAEVVNVSAAGKGIYKSVYSPDLTSQIPAVYQSTVWPEASPPYAFAEQKVAAVVVQAGSNDLAGKFKEGVFPDPNAFISTYANLLATVRQHRPQAAIVSIVTQGAAAGDKATLHGALEQAIALRAQAGDAEVYLYDYFQNDPNKWTWYGDASDALKLGSGCEGHPSEAGAAFLAERLATFIKTLPAWARATAQP